MLREALFYGDFITKSGADEKISHTSKPLYKTPIKSTITTECATISATCFMGVIIITIYLILG